jgi:hypothetical protein
MRYGDRNYDRSIAGLGTGKAHRYFAYGLDRLSGRLFDAKEIAAARRVTSRTAVLRALGQYSNAVPDRGNIAVDELDEEPRIGSTS